MRGVTSNSSVLQPALHPWLQNKHQIVSSGPATHKPWGGGIRPWGASFSVLLIPAGTASDSDNPVTNKWGCLYK